MSFRLTYAEAGIRAITGVDPSGLIQRSTTIAAGRRIEVRDEEGQIIRMSSAAELTLIDSPLGLKPEYFGEVAILKKGGCGKYRTSCWNAAYGTSGRPDIFWRPSGKGDVDEVFAVTGEIVIYEFDENLKQFVICSLCEGEKATLTINSSASTVRDRYSAAISQYTDAEYGYILENYLDSRRWR